MEDSKPHWWKGFRSHRHLHRSKPKEHVEDSTAYKANMQANPINNNVNNIAFAQISPVALGRIPARHEAQLGVHLVVGKDQSLPAVRTGQDTGNGKLEEKHRELKSTLDEIDRLRSFSCEDAYFEALTHLSKKDQQFLSDMGEKGEISILLQQLNAKDSEKQSQSFLNRTNIRSSVEKVGMVCNYVELLAPFIPAPGFSTALDLIKGVVGIMLGICGIYQDLTGDIQKLLSHLPILNRYKSVIKSDHKSVAIFKSLVKAYTCLLHFYTWVMEFLQKERFIEKVFEPFRSAIPDIVSTFNGLVDNLDKLVQAEALANTEELKQQQVKDYVEKKFGCCQALTCRYNTQENPGKILWTACQWLHDEPAFEEWHKSTRGGLLTIFGKMGCGKSATAIYIAKFLRDEPTGSNAPVLLHRCKEQETSLLLGLYQNLTYQLLKVKPKLQVDFMEWYEQCERRNYLYPLHTQEPPLLQHYLKTTIQDLKTAIFIIVDGLDEMKTKDRKELLSFLKELVKSALPVKVFLTSRESDDIHHILHQERNTLEDNEKVPLFHVAMDPGKPRDFALAEHLLGCYSEWADEDTSKELLKKAATQLSESAEGSAIWLKLATQTLEGRHVKDENGFRRQLEWLQSGPSLLSLYGRLFDRQMRTTENDQAPLFLERALEILAVAQRPLSVLELSCAVSMDVWEASSLAQLGQDTRSEVDFVKELVSPFVNLTSTQEGLGVAGPQGRMELVHPSLSETVFQASPTQWTIMASSKRSTSPRTPRSQLQASMIERRARLHASMLKRCIDYMMFDELHNYDIRAELEGDGTVEVAQSLAFMQSFIFPEEDMIEEGSGLLLDDLFIPDEGKFGHFFTYAGAFWPHHFAECPHELRPQPTQLTSLCAHNTQCLKNWVEMWKRPSSKYAVELPYIEIEQLDPLVVFSYVEPTAATLAGIAKFKEEKPGCFQEFSEFRLLERLVRHGRVEVVRNLLDDPQVGKHLLDEPETLGSILFWSATDPESIEEVEEGWLHWRDVLDMIVERQGRRLEDGARFALEVACRRGCLEFLKSLFEAADRFPEIRTKLVSAGRLPPANGHNSVNGIYNHQPLGTAAFYGHAEIVEFLCRQEGIDQQLEYRNKRGHTVFHVLAAPQSRSDIQIFLTLFQMWPDGSRLPANDGMTPIELLVATGRRLEVLTTWLDTAKYDASVLDEDKGAMETAISYRRFDACCELVTVGGADPWKVVELGAGGELRLRDKYRHIESTEPGNAKRLVDVFCRLIGNDPKAPLSGVLPGL